MQDNKTAKPQNGFYGRVGKVIIFYFVALSTILILGGKSSLLDKTGFSREDFNRNMDNRLLSHNKDSLLLEVMAFDSSYVSIIDFEDSLFSGEVYRGQVKRFYIKDSCEIYAEYPGNIRIFANGVPLYFPNSPKRGFRATLSGKNYSAYIDTLLLGEAKR